MDNPLQRERDRWFFWQPVLFAVGIALYFARQTEPALLATCIGFVSIVAARIAIHPLAGLRVLLTILVVIGSGFVAAKLRTEWVAAPVLLHQLRSADLTGQIEQIEPFPDKSMRITIRVTGIKGLSHASTPRRVRVRLRKFVAPLHPGQGIRIRVRLSAPSAPAIPRGYDFARAAYFQGIGAVGYALSQPQIIEPQSPLPLLTRWHAELQKLRRSIGDRIEAALPGETGIMANALMTGERSGISQATNDLYRDAGIFHILSISGLHMAIMGGAVFLALRFMLAAFPFIALRYPIKKWAAVAAAIATFGYLLISGGAHPTVRSFIMILIAFIAIVLDRPAIALRNVALAALIILVVLPESLFNAGFQLSFAAVVALIATYEAYEARKRRLRTLGYTALKPTGAMFGALRGIALFMAGTIATTVIAGLATAPFAAFHFHTSQQYSVLTNMLAIPVSNLIVMPAALAAFVAMPLSLERMPLAVMGWGIDFMTWAAGLVTAMPGAVTAVPAFPEYALQAMVFGGLWLCIWRMNWRWLGLAVVFAGLYLTTTGSYPDALIGRDGRIVAVRGSDGRLAAIKADRASYEFGRWLENDGDPRKPAEAWSKAPFRCDLEGCTARLAQHLIAIPRSPAALTDDCKHAAVLVMSFPKPPGCQTDAVVLDYSVLNRHGTHTVYLDLSGNLRLENVEQFRGQRPWSVATLEAARQQEFEQLRAARRTRQFRSETRDVEAAAASPQYQRPEIDDGHPLYWFQ